MMEERPGDDEPTVGSPAATLHLEARMVSLETRVGELIGSIERLVQETHVRNVLAQDRQEMWKKLWETASKSWAAKILVPILLARALGIDVPTVTSWVSAMAGGGQ